MHNEYATQIVSETYHSERQINNKTNHRLKTGSNKGNLDIDSKIGINVLHIQCLLNVANCLIFVASEFSPTFTKMQLLKNIESLMNNFADVNPKFFNSSDSPFKLFFLKITSFLFFLLENLTITRSLHLIL